MQTDQKKNTEKQSTNFDVQKQRLISPTSKKIKIQQNVQNPNTRNIPHHVKRAIEDPKKIVLERRTLLTNGQIFNQHYEKSEGSKPLFDRGDVKVNQSPNKSSKEKRRSSSRSSANDSDYYKRRRNRERSKSKSSDRSSSSGHNLKSSEKKERYKTRSYRRDKSHSPKKKEEKVPYFIDSVREQDRIKQKYKNTRKHSEGSRERNRSQSRKTKSRERRRSYNRSRSRSRSRSWSDSRRRSGRRRSSSRSRRRRHRSRSRSSNPDRRNNLPNYLQASSQPFIPLVPVNYPYPTWVPPPIVRYPPYMLRPLGPVIAPPLPPPFLRPPYFRQRFPRFRQNYKP